MPKAAADKVRGSYDRMKELAPEAILAVKNATAEENQQFMNRKRQEEQRISEVDDGGRRMT